MSLIKANYVKTAPSICFYSLSTESPNLWRRFRLLVQQFVFVLREIMAGILNLDRVSRNFANRKCEWWGYKGWFSLNYKYIMNISIKIIEQLNNHFSLLCKFFVSLLFLLCYYLHDLSKWLFPKAFI